MPTSTSVRWLDLLPGLALCGAIGAGAELLQQVETGLFGRAWIEALVLAILIGAAVRTAWAPGPRWKPGIEFCARPLLEVAVVLLGASLSAATVLAAGWPLFLAIVLIVAGSLALSFAVGRMLGLAPRLAVLVACGNSICGNSAIAAVAPVIGAKPDEVSSSIAFTAVLGLVVVLLLPLVGGMLAMTPLGYGALAGLTVYAVPQVLAATAPMGAAAVQLGTMVKLSRVLMLGPVCLGLSLIGGRLRDPGADREAARPRLGQYVPWFVLGFLGMAGLRSAGLIPEPMLAPIAAVATVLTVIAMAALGLGVDVRAVARSSGRVTVTVILSLLALGLASLAAVRVIGL